MSPRRGAPGLRRLRRGVGAASRYAYDRSVLVGAGPHLASLERHERADAPTRRAHMVHLLRSQLDHFAAWPEALPEWRAASQVASDEEFVDAWRSIPVLTKAALRDRFPPEVVAERSGLPGRVSRTGGSTGEPTAVYHDRDMVRAARAKVAFVRRRLGVTRGMTTICLWGSDRDVAQRPSPRTRMSHLVSRQVMIEGFGIGPDTTRAVLEAIDAHAPVAVYGFTSMLEEVARQVVAAGARPPRGSVAVAWNGGEALSLRQSDVFEDAFGVPIHNLYGGRELNAIACAFNAGGALHVLEPLNLIEVLDPEGDPVDAGVEGSLVATSTVCRGTPLIRYQVGDLGVPAAGADRLALGSSALELVGGREGGVVTLRDGRRVSNLFWNHLLRRYPTVEQFQVVVDEGDTIALHLRGGHDRSAVEEGLRNDLAPLFGGYPVQIRWVDSIDLTARGKLVQVVDRRRGT